MKKVLTLVLALALTLGLTACGGGGSSDPNAGVYQATAIEMWGVELAVDEVYTNGASLELKDGGKATINLDGTKSSCKWTLEGTDLSLDISGEVSTGTLENGVIKLDLMGMDLIITFVKEGGGTEPVASWVDWWTGDWYGWWIISQCSDSYSDMSGTWEDCCASITMDNNGNGSIVIWDLSKDNPMAQIEISASPDSGAGEMGAACSEGGYLLDMELEHADMIIDPSLYGVDNIIVIDVFYEDSEGECKFEFFLRPWGQKWDDLLVDTGNLPYEDMMPSLYDDWYLPLIEAGAAMPDSFDKY